jgi:hypothetical protein
VDSAGTVYTAHSGANTVRTVVRGGIIRRLAGNATRTTWATGDLPGRPRCHRPRASLSFVRVTSTSGTSETT